MKIELYGHEEWQQKKLTGGESGPLVTTSKLDVKVSN